MKIYLKVLKSCHPTLPSRDEKLERGLEASSEGLGYLGLDNITINTYK
jgi:hypothetical protein